MPVAPGKSIPNHLRQLPHARDVTRCGCAAGARRLDRGHWMDWRRTERRIRALRHGQKRTWS